MASTTESCTAYMLQWMCSRMELRTHLCMHRAVALAFKAQLVEFVPTATHDVDVDILVTADETTACSARGRQAIAGQL